MDALALLEAGDEPRDARVVQRLQRRRLALEGVDLLRARHGRELQFLERDDRAVRRGGAVDAAVRALTEDAPHAVAAGDAGDAAERAARLRPGTAAPWTGRFHLPPHVHPDKAIAPRRALRSRRSVFRKTTSVVSVCSVVQSSWTVQRPIRSASVPLRAGSARKRGWGSALQPTLVRPPRGHDGLDRGGGDPAGQTVGELHAAEAVVLVLDAQSGALVHLEVARGAVARAFARRGCLRHHHGAAERQAVRGRG